MELTIRELADQLGAELELGGRDENDLITGISSINASTSGDVTYMLGIRMITSLRKSDAAGVIVAKPVNNLDKAQLIVSDVDAAVIKVLNHFAPPLAPPAVGVDPTAVVGKDVTIGENVHIGPHVSIENNVTIGDNSVISAGCRIGQRSTVGSYTWLDANVVVYHYCQIGNHCRILANAVIGAIGFGYAFIDGALKLVPHNGGVIIEDHVEIGANCCIDRAKFNNTIVGSGTKMDNLVQIGHNVIIGKMCLFSAQSGVAGSTVVGDGVVLGGQSGVADNLTVADKTMLGAKSGLMKSTTEPGQKMAWNPAIERKRALKILSEMVQLPELMAQFRELAERFEKLDAAENDQG